MLQWAYVALKIFHWIPRINSSSYVCKWSLLTTLTGSPLASAYWIPGHRLARPAHQDALLSECWVKIAVQVSKAMCKAREMLTSKVKVWSPNLGTKLKRVASKTKRPTGYLWDGLPRRWSPQRAHFTGSLVGRGLPDFLMQALTLEPPGRGQPLN